MKTYDYRGLKCPIPVLKAYKIFKSLNKSKSYKLSFLCDDESAPRDFTDFCNNTGLVLVSIKKNDSAINIILEHKPNSEK